MINAGKKKSAWRWVRRGGLGVFGLLVILAALPFLFTTAIARWVVGRSSYARFSPEIGSAALSPGGQLVLRNVVLHEVGVGAGKVLLKAGKLGATFSWATALAGTLKDIQAEDVTIYVRAGEAAEGTVPVSLLELVAGAGADPVKERATLAALAAVKPAEKPFWFDHLSCAGTLNVERFDDYNVAPATFPFLLTMRMRGDGFRPARDLTLRIGEAGDKAVATAAAHFEPEGAGQRITVEEITLRDIRAGLGEECAKKTLAGWPAVFQQALDGHAEKVTVSATFEPGPAGMIFSGHAEVSGLGVTSRAGVASKLELKGFKFSATANGAVGKEFLRSGTMEAGTLALDSLVLRNNTLEHFKTAVTLREGMLEAPAVKAVFGGGAFVGLVQYSAAEGKLKKASFTVQHLDQEQVAANIAPDKLEASGALSGTIDLTAGAKSALTGKIDLRSDGPGRLKIKDQAAAGALADKLQGVDVSGVLPANFSDIVVGQLKDYPYKTARIQVADRDGSPVLSLDYARDNVQSGEPGFAVKTTIAGQQVTANYTIQLPGVTVLLKGQTVDELVKMAAGLGQQIASGEAGK